MPSRSVLTKSTALAFLGILPVAAVAFGAAGTHVDVNSGHELARAWCRSCHAVEPGELTGPYADVPTFTAVARLPSTTETSLRVFLTTPHGDMPDIKLNAGQIADLVDYILSLKS